jgi:signal transduction histidine kinase
VVLEFRDNGPGISDTAMQRLFDPFFTTKEPGRGTGLGLSISHTIIQRHSGTIRAYNDNGAVFRIEIPVAESETEPLPAAA